MSFDIDVVYTWVNHDDPHWQRLYEQATAGTDAGPDVHASVDNPARFQNRDEILFSIKSVKKFAPWVRSIYVVSNCQLPPALRDDEQVIPVAHEEIFRQASALPTFNSRAIEANLHRIPGLAEHILYFNDDFFLCRPAAASDFFPAAGKAYVFPSKHDIPYGVKKGLRPIDYGALNACELLIRDFGYTPAKKLHHSPYPLLRTNLVELEQKYEQRFLDTSSHKFRDNTDIPAATTLQAYYSIATGRGVLRDIQSRYVDIGDPLFVLLIHPLSPLRRGKYQTLCLNEVTSPRWFAGTRDAIVRRFLRAMFDA